MAEIIPDDRYLRREFDDLEELRSSLAATYEVKNEATWELCDLCAIARLAFPYTTPTGRSLVGLLASDLACSRQQVRRFIKRAMTFPPHITYDTGEIVIIRDQSKPFNLYDTAIEWAPRFELDALACVIKALDEDWSAGQLLAWIKDEERANGSAPHVWRDLFSTEIYHPDSPTDLLEEISASLYAQFRALAEEEKPVLSVKVNINAYVPGDEPLAGDNDL